MSSNGIVFVEEVGPASVWAYAMPAEAGQSVATLTLEALRLEVEVSTIYKLVVISRCFGMG